MLESQLLRLVFLNDFETCWSLSFFLSLFLVSFQRIRTRRAIRLGDIETVDDDEEYATGGDGDVKCAQWPRVFFVFVSSSQNRKKKGAFCQERLKKERRGETDDCCCHFLCVFLHIPRGEPRGPHLSSLRLLATDEPLGSLLDPTDDERDGPNGAKRRKKNAKELNYKLRGC